MVKKWPVQHSTNQPRSAAKICRFLSRFFPHTICLTVHTCIWMVKYGIDILKHENSQSNCHEVCRRAAACWNQKLHLICAYEIWILQLDAWIHSTFRIFVIPNSYHLHEGRETWLPEATIFASSYKPSLKIWNPTVMKYVEEQRLVGIKNAHALRLWNLDIATWCMNSFYILNFCHSK